MFLRRLFLLLVLAVPLFAGLKNLTLHHALQILKHDNLELKISRFNEQMKAYEIKAVTGLNYGKLDVTVMGMRSNDAGNVFGFKLQSREASFGDFGFKDFLGGFGQAMIDPGTGLPNFNAFAQNMGNPVVQNQLLELQPKDLNYPAARNHFQTKFSYMVPLYTGGKLTEYKHITQSMYKMSKFNTKQLLNVKIYETKKAFYDISLVENYIANLSKIIYNISKLESIVVSMQHEGYAQDIDLLEVQARKAEAQSMLNQAKLNKDLAYQFLSFLLNTEVSKIRKLSDMAPMPHISKSDLEANNIDIQKALLGLKISKMAIDVQKSSFLPEIGAFGEYGSADNVFMNDFFDKDSYTFGVQVKWNIFNGGVDAANLEKAKLKHLMVRDQVALAKRGIALKVKQLKTQVLSANADVRSYKKQLNFARRVYQNYRARYKEGIVSISDVLIKQSKELEVLLKLLTAKNKRNTKIFELESILNKGGNV